MPTRDTQQPSLSGPPANSVRAWVLASRPATLPAAIVPVLVGSAIAATAGSFRPDIFIAALLVSLLLQIGANFANDYFDFQKGADTAERLGPQRVTQSGLISPARVRNGMISTFILAGVVGLYLGWVGGWPIVAIGALAIAAAVLYTGGPWPFGYHGLGDLFVFIFFGLVAVAGTAYLHTGSLSTEAVFFALPVALLVTAILVVNNLRDIDTDRRAGKRTLAVLIGVRATRSEYMLLVGCAYVLLPLGWLLGLATGWVLLPWLSLPLALRLVGTIVRTRGAPLNAALKGTGQLHLLFGVLLAVGILL